MPNKIYPFKFLDAYTKSDQSIFFGREEEIDKLFTACNNSNIILLYGASGVGKTSLVQCGLSKRLSRHSWVDIYIRRGQNINDSLQEVLARYESQEEEDLLSDVDMERSPLEQQIHNIYLEYFRPIYLIFDQFEELFVLGTEEEQEQFYATVAELLAMKQEVKLIFSVREEYLASLYPFEQRVEALMQHRIRVEPMSLSKIALVLKGINQLPGSLVSIKKGEEEALAELLCQQFQSKGNRLPLPYFQVILDKLYRQIGQEEAVLSVKEARKLPKMDDIMRAFLEERIGVIADRDEAVQEQLWTMLLGMVSLEGTKIPMDRQALAQKVGLNPSFVQEQLEALVSNRILRYREEDEVYELAHDSLALSVAEKRSGDEKELLSIKAYLQSVLQMEVALQEPLSENWLARIEPLLIKLRLSDEELAYVQHSQRYQQEQRAKEIQAIREQEARERKVLEERKELEKKVLRTRLLLSGVLLVILIALSSYAFYTRYLKNQVLANIDFYDGKYGLTVKKDSLGQMRYGYINRDGEEMLAYQYTEARPFMRNGFARVKIDSALYLIDTTGRRYPLAESVRGITDSTLAVNLEEQLLEEVPEEVLDHKKLEVLLMSGNVVRALPEELVSLSDLRVVDLSYNRLSGNVSPLFSKLEALEQLNLASNQLSKAILEEGFERLIVLDLSKNALDTFSNIQGGLDQLEYLNLYDNRLRSLEGLKGVNRLKRLNASENYLRGISLQETQEFSALEELNVYGNQIQEASALDALSSLRILNIMNNPLNAQTVAVLGRFLDGALVGEEKGRESSVSVKDQPIDETEEDIVQTKEDEESTPTTVEEQIILEEEKDPEALVAVRDARDGEVYNVVRIGKQVWMSENMRYNVAGSKINPANPSKAYGRLYTWAQAKQACPKGWHLPSDEEWKELERALGMSEEDIERDGYRGSIGGRLKSTSNWPDEGKGNNHSNFNALPAGGSWSVGYKNLGKSTYYWTSTEFSSERAWGYSLHYNDDKVGRRNGNKVGGYSCRCVKDDEVDERESSLEEEKQDLEAKTLSRNRIKDLRDGEIYKTVQIGKQVWMSENMRYNVAGSKINPANPSKAYGRLYTWAQAKKACPKGWHLPSDEEWKELERALGGRKKLGVKIKSRSGWINKGGGTNGSGFEALPVGVYTEGTYKFLGERSGFWTSKERSMGRAWGRILLYDARQLFRGDDDKENGYSCRCIKNNEEEKGLTKDKEPQEKKKEKEGKNDQSLGIFKDERDGEVYKTVQIGNQTWMSENMRYNVSGSQLNPKNPNKKYGRLYTWKQALGVCPKGWHLPSDEEWKVLERYLGMSESNVNEKGYRSGDIGDKLKSTSGWENSRNAGNGSNSSGFNALPAGYYMSGSFDDLDEGTYFWSSTENSSDLAWFRYLYYHDYLVSRRTNDKSYGYSCRCIKD